MNKLSMLLVLACSSLLAAGTANALPRVGAGLAAAKQSVAKSEVKEPVPGDFCFSKNYDRKENDKIRRIFFETKILQGGDVAYKIGIWDWAEKEFWYGEGQCTPNHGSTIEFVCKDKYKFDTGGLLFKVLNDGRLSQLSAKDQGGLPIWHEGILGSYTEGADETLIMQLTSCTPNN